MQDWLNGIWSAGVLPSIADALDGGAAELANAISQGGVGVTEFNMAVPNAAESIRAALKRCPEMGIGAFGVTTPAQCGAAIEAGARFVSGTGFDPEPAELCAERDIPYIPACVTSHEIALAYRQGVRVVRFVNAACNGGAEAIQSLAQVFPDVRFLVSGGVTPENITAYMRTPAVLAVCAAWPITRDRLFCGKWDEITADCQKAVRLVHGFELYHLGVNTENADAARALAQKLNHAFGFEAAEGPFAMYSTRVPELLTTTLYDCNMQPVPVSNERGWFYYTADFEIMKKIARGANGHLGIRANSIERAIVYLEQRGYRMDRSTQYFADNRMFTIYMDDDIDFGGFSVHLLQK